MRPFGYPVTILNTIDHLGKFDGKVDEGFFVGYSLNSKAFRVFNSRTRIVEENLYIRFSESTPNVVGSGPDWLFNIDALTRTMNYEPIFAGTRSNGFVDPKSSHDDGSKPSSDDKKKVDEDPRKDSKSNDQEKEDNVNSTNNVNAASTSEVNVVGGKTSIELPVDLNMPALEDSRIFDDKDDGAEADMNNWDTTIQIEAMQEELLQFKLQEVWTLVDLPNGKRAIGTKWVFRNKKDERGIMIRNKARLVAQGYTQEEGINYDEVFAHVYVCQPPGFEDPDFLDKLYKVEKALYGLHQAPRACSMGELTFFLGLQVQQKKDDIFISQDKYVGEILKKFRFIEVKTASTPMETQKPLLKDKDGEEVDVHMYRSMIGSLMYLISSRPDIMFAVCACARYQVNPKVLHLHAVKRIFRYLKGQPKLGLWYLKDSPFDLVAYTDSDYAGASLDRKSTIGESTVRRDLQLEDAEGIDCLPNATIFEQLALMGPKTTAWNEFSSTMASTIICLATNQKFNFSKYIFESMVKNLDNVGKVLMYPRFVQVFLDNQLEGISDHKRIYIAPSHTKMIFRNMRRVGKRFFRRETPLFPTMVVHNQEEIGEGSTIPTDTHHTPTFIQPSPQPQKTQKPRRPKKKDTHVPQSSVPSDSVIDEAVYRELDDSLVRTATTTSSLEAEQDSGGGPRRQETIGDTIIQTRSKNLSKLSNDPLLTRGNTLRSGEDSLKLYELMALCTTLQIRVLDLEITKTTQGNEIASQKRRVKKLERRNKSRTHKLKRLYKVGLTSRIESSRDEEDLVNDDNEMFDMDALAGEGVFVIEQSRNVIEEVVVVIDAASTIPVSAAIIIDVEITLAQVLAKLKNAKPKADKDKGKGIMVEEPMLEQVKPIKRLKQMRLNEELAFKLQAEEEEERLAREKAQ
ncbi:retrovirus-related pol polyprotein from transposon TNT 1-94 [Tanacetum coccineum]